MNTSPMLDFLKAMADADRLRIIGVLAHRRANRSEIAGRLGMPLREVVDHLTFLVRVGVLRESDGLYELHTTSLEELARSQLSEQRPAYVPAPDLDEKSRKVLAAYLNADGTLKQIPLQPAKLRVILDYLVAAFTPGVDYTEKEVNTILRRFHVDTAALRRYLVDEGLMARKGDGSRYWRTEGRAE